MGIKCERRCIVVGVIMVPAGVANLGLARTPLFGLQTNSNETVLKDFMSHTQFMFTRHFVVYVLITCFLLRYFGPRHGSLTVCLVVFGIGLAMEIGQGLTGYRHFELQDIFVNTCGIVFSWVVFGSLMANAMPVMDVGERPAPLELPAGEA